VYTKSARFYDALYSFKDYGDASARLHQLIQTLHPQAKTLLDVACGTGQHLRYLQHHYTVTGLDLSAELLARARERCPEVPFHQANMIQFELTGRFDIITSLFSSIAYVKTPENLHRTVGSMARHLAPGGILILEPWFWPEKYWTGTITANFVNEPDLKIAWMYTSNPPENQVATLDINYLVGTPQGIEHFTEKHDLGLFDHQEYCSAFTKAGLAVNHDPVGLFKRGLYFGKQKD
jgi:SAM-dependent methyltransferase